MTEVVAFRAWHRHQIVEAHTVVGCDAPVALWDAVERQGRSITLLVDGRVVMCGGVVEYEPGKFEAWASVDKDGRRHALAIHRTARDVMSAALETCRSIRALVVKDGFHEGHKWVRRLGFRPAGVVSGQHPAGVDCVLYALEAEWTR